MPGEAAQQALEQRRLGAHLADDVATLVDLQRLERHGAAQRVAAIGVAVAEHADLAGVLLHHVGHVLIDRHRRQRRVGGGQLLGHRHRGGRHAHRGGAEPVSGAPEAADHLIVDHQHVVLGQHRHDRLEIALRRHDHPARAHHRLGDEGGHRLRPLGFDEGVELGGQPRRHLALGLAGQAVAPVMRAGDVLDAVHRQVEVAVVVGQAGQRGGDDGHAVIGLAAADDLLLFGPPARVVVIPRQLDLGLIGLRAAGLIEHLAHRNRRQFLDLLGQFDRRLMAAAAEQVVIGQTAQLFARRLDQFCVAKAKPCAPQARHAFDIALALIVEHIDALPALHDVRADFAVRDGVGVGVQQRLDIAGLHVRQAVAVHGHRASSRYESARHNGRAAAPQQGGAATLAVSGRRRRRR